MTNRKDAFDALYTLAQEAATGHELNAIEKITFDNVERSRVEYMILVIGDCAVCDDVMTRAVVAFAKIMFY